MSVWIIVQARMSSTRFPGKVLADLHGAPMILRQLERLARSSARVAVATSIGRDDDPIADAAAGAGFTVVRGPLDDVLARYTLAAEQLDADPVVRITADCPLADPEIVDEMLARWPSSGADMLTNVSPPTYPDGLDVEIVSSAALRRAQQEITDPTEREHVTLHLHRHPESYRHEPWTISPDRSTERWTVDYPQDLEFVRAIYRELYPIRGAAFGRADVDALLARRPDIAALQVDIARNEALGAD